MSTYEHVGSYDDLIWCRETMFGNGVAKAIIWRIATDGPHLYVELDYDELALEHEFTVEEIRAAVGHLVTHGFARISYGFQRYSGEVLVLLSPGRLVDEAIQRAKDEEKAAKRAAKVALRGGRVSRASIPSDVRALVFTRDHYRCARCSATEDLTLDHIQPWSLGGPDTADNLQVLCRSCNSAKGDRP